MRNVGGCGPRIRQHPARAIGDRQADDQSKQPETNARPGTKLFPWSTGDDRHSINPLFTGRYDSRRRRQKRHVQANGALRR